MTQTNTLPEVATNFYSHCKKCDAERYHKVLAHPTDKSAKLQCEVCKAKSTYKLPSEKKAKKTLSGAPRAARVPRVSHASEYETLLAKASSNDELKYSIKAKFEVDQKITHPKFGIGIIKTSMTDRVEVVFSDEVKTLMHNRA